MAVHVITPEEYNVFRSFLEDACGIVLGDNKDYLVVSRLNRLLSQVEVDSLQDLIELATQGRNANLRGRIIDAMTTNETLWFRDNYPYEILKQHILPELAKKRPRQIRIWSAACSSGEEPYSISMAIQEYLAAKPMGLPDDIQIVATDISSSILEQAMSATYDEKSLIRGLSPERRRNFFMPIGNRWRVKEEICRRIRFQAFNLKGSFAALGKFDAVFCRNVLIYFSTELKQGIFKRMAAALNLRGHLMLGGSESLAGYSDAFEMVRYQTGIAYRLKRNFKP